jgi:hypothetical protein
MAQTEIVVAGTMPSGSGVSCVSAASSCGGHVASARHPESVQSSWRHDDSPGGYFNDSPLFKTARVPGEGLTAVK